MRLLRAAAASTRGRLVIAAVLLYLLWQLALTLIAPTKITGEFPPDRARVNVLVTLRFPPERFHVLAFQQHGRVSGTLDDTVEVRGVKRADLGALARPYWVKRVAPLPEEGS